MDRERGAILSLRERSGPQVDEKLNKGIQFAQIYYIKLGIHSFYVLPYQPEVGTASRDNFSGTDGMLHFLEKPPICIS